MLLLNEKINAASIQSNNPKLLLRLNNTWSGWQVFNGSMTVQGNIQLNGTCTGSGCGGGGGGGGSPLSVGKGSLQDYTQVSSPTTHISLATGAFNVSLISPSTAFITHNFSSVTAQGNVLAVVSGSTNALASFFSSSLSTHSLRIDQLQVFASTGQQQIYALSLDTGTLKSAFNTFTSTNDAEHTKNVNFLSTHSTRIDELQADLSTHSTRIDQLQVFASTAQQQIYALSLDTGTFYSQFQTHRSTTDTQVLTLLNAASTTSVRLQNVEVSTGLAWAQIASTHTAFRVFSSTNDAEHAKNFNFLSTHSLVNDTQNSTMTRITQSTTTLHNAFYNYTSTADAAIAAASGGGSSDNLGSHVSTMILTAPYGVYTSSVVADSSATIRGIIVSTTGALLGSATVQRFLTVNEFGTMDNSTPIFRTNGSTLAIFGTTGDIFLSTHANFGLGVSSFGASAKNVLAIATGTAPTTGIRNGIQMYARTVSSTAELVVRDEAGNTTTLSPHNFSLVEPSEDMAWSYTSEKDRTMIQVDMLRVIRALERLTGETYVYKRRKE